MSIEPNADQSKPSLLLLVEDNDANILIATTILNDLGYSFDLAKNGYEAVDLFKKRAYSLILMDIQMPIMNGIEATELIRSYESDIRQPPTPIIALTANNTVSDREKCIACGMDDYITKPYMPDRLASVIAGYRL